MLRYGPYSLAVESKYDHPMLWGSKRTGPDLARVGGKYSDAWQVAHLVAPRALVPESVMPHYAFLLDEALEVESLPARLSALRGVVPYTDAMIENAAADAGGQARPDSEAAAGVAERYGEATNIRSFDARPDRLTQMDALVAYLQTLGKLTDLPEMTQLLTTPTGWVLLLVGSAVGALFAAFAFAISVFAVPMLLEERTDAMTALGTSMALVWNNLTVMLVWGAIVLGLFVLSVLTAFVGLIVVFSGARTRDLACLPCNPREQSRDRTDVHSAGVRSRQGNCRKAPARPRDFPGRLRTGVGRPASAADDREPWQV